jgi:cytochrome c oxidase subunit II
MNEWLKSILLKPGNSDLSSGDWSTDGLFMFITWLCIVSFFVCMVPMVYWAIVYRRRPGVPAQRTPNHNTALEVTWVVVPLVLLTAVFFWGFKGYMRSQVAKGNAEVINLAGFKWGWEFTYRNGAGSGALVYLDDEIKLNAENKPEGKRGNVQVPIVAVPAGVPVKFVMTSRDVMHSFYIPDMRLKMDMFPNRYTSLTFIPQTDQGPDQAGKITDLPSLKPGRDHFVFCAEYCGELHSEMAAVMRVMTPSDFDATLIQWGDLYGGKSFVEAGKIVYAKRCATCHSVDGGKNTGPTWKGVWGTDVPIVGGGTVKYDENYTRESILNPAAKIHQGYANQMPSFAGQLSETEILGVIAYIRDLSGKTTAEDQSIVPKK